MILGALLCPDRRLAISTGPLVVDRGGRIQCGSGGVWSGSGGVWRDLYPYEAAQLREAGEIGYLSDPIPWEPGVDLWALGEGWRQIGQPGPALRVLEERDGVTFCLVRSREALAIRRKWAYRAHCWALAMARDGRLEAALTLARWGIGMEVKLRPARVGLVCAILRALWRSDRLWLGLVERSCGPARARAVERAADRLLAEVRRPRALFCGR